MANFLPMKMLCTTFFLFSAFIELLQILKNWLLVLIEED